jgi:hypothetical protein
MFFKNAFHPVVMIHDLHESIFFREGLCCKVEANLNLQSRVARWFLFKPKIPIWENFGGP